MNNINSIIDDMKPYILNTQNMNKYLKYKFSDKISDKISDKTLKYDERPEINKKENKQNKITANNQKEGIFFPHEKDSLFWCYYIIRNGEMKYDILGDKNELVTKKEKIALITEIRENKSIVKTHKLDTITNIESNLANDDIVSIKTICSLCAIHNINILFIKNKTYFELCLNDNNPFYMIREEGHSKYKKKYGFQMLEPETLNDIRNTLYQINKLDKPLNAISAYKAPELIEIANKLSIPYKNNENGKNKTKKEVYELIMQFLN